MINLVMKPPGGGGGGGGMSSLGGLPSLDKKPEQKVSAPKDTKDDFISSLFGEEGSTETLTKLSEESDMDMRKLMGSSDDDVKTMAEKSEDDLKKLPTNRDKDEKVVTDKDKKSKGKCSVLFASYRSSSLLWFI